MKVSESLALILQFVVLLSENPKMASGFNNWNLTSQHHKLIQHWWWNKPTRICPHWIKTGCGCV